MALGSPGKFSVDDINFKETDGCTIEKIDPNLTDSKEWDEGNAHENELWGDRAEANLNHQHHGLSTLHAVELESPHNKFSSQVQHGLYNDSERTEDIEFSREKAPSYQGGETGIASHGLYNDSERTEDMEFDREKVHSYQGGEAGVSSGRHSDNSSSPVEAVTFKTELEMENLSRFSEVNSNDQFENMKENLPNEAVIESSDKFSGNLQHEKAESADEVMEQEGAVDLMEKDYVGNEPLMVDKYDSGNREIKEGNTDVHAFGRMPQRSASLVSERPASPERAPSLHEKLSSSPQGPRDTLHSPRSPKRKLSPSPERTAADSRRVISEDHPSPSKRSRRGSPHRDNSLRKRSTSSPRRRQLSPNHRRPERSMSRSPTASRGSSYGSRREYHHRSRSRSPHGRDRYRRSPRRYSPRRRSPPGYHSRRRSPRRRPWSPPRNRNNGAGKPGNNLFVAGFNFVTTERDLERKFSRFGRVKDVRIVRDTRTGDSRGFGFLSLERDEDADAAIRALDQTQWNGRVVLVEKSKSR